jgi:Na+/proline symporter
MRKVENGRSIIKIYVALFLIVVLLLCVGKILSTATILSNYDIMFTEKWDWILVPGYLLVWIIGFVVYCLSLFILPYCGLKLFRLYRERKKEKFIQHLVVALMALIFTFLGSIVLAIDITNIIEGK